jgi:hypothetical protein
MDPNVRDTILSRKRATEIAEKFKQADTSSVAEVRQKLGASLSDEELILLVYTGMDRASLTRSGAPTARPNDIASILQAMDGYQNIRSVSIKTKTQQLLFE